MKRFFVLVLALLLLPLGSASLEAQESYKIKTGDVLRIEVLEDASLNREALVLPDGRISLPLVGTVAVSGRSIDEVRSEVISKLRPNFAADPSVFVSLAQLAAPRATSVVPRERLIYILGEVATPGAIEIKRNTTVLQALALAGGFSRFAAVKRIQLRRTQRDGKELLYNINYNDVLAGKSSIGATTLKEGDVIIVPQRKLFE